MKVVSKGLGRRELVMDFRRYQLRRDGEDVVVAGTITEPVTWDFSIRMTPDDIPGLLRMALSSMVFGLGVRWLKGISTGRAKAVLVESPPKPVLEVVDNRPAASPRPGRVHSGGQGPARIAAGALRARPGSSAGDPVPGHGAARPPLRTASAFAASVGSMARPTSRPSTSKPPSQSPAARDGRTAASSYVARDGSAAASSYVARRAGASRRATGR